MKVLKYVLRAIALVVVLVLLIGAVLYVRGSSAIGVTYDAAVDMVEIPTDSASIARGEYIMRSHACQKCHGDDLSGSVMADAPPFLAVASNLTRGEGGIGASYTDADWLRAIRHGVKPSGKGTWIMPAEAYYMMSDQEVGALVAYLKQIDPVDHLLPATEIRPLGRLIAGMDAAFRPTHEALPDLPRLEGREPGATAEWGEYRASVLCGACHGRDMLGSQPPDPAAPFAPDLRTAARWSTTEFKTALRTGVTPAGREIDDTHMPWKAIGHLSDMELEALHVYFNTL